MDNIVYYKSSCQVMRQSELYLWLPITLGMSVWNKSFMRSDRVIDGKEYT